MGEKIEIYNLLVKNTLIIIQESPSIPFALTDPNNSGQ